jgi:hypothetical protein
MNIDKLNASLMNIPCKIRDENWTPAEQFIYKLGHRDARHQAVEVVLEHVKDEQDFLETLSGAAKEASDEWIAGYVRQHFGVYR